MTVYGIVGMLDDLRDVRYERPASAGNGKTQLLSHFLYQEFVQKDRPVIANYHLYYPGGKNKGVSWATYMSSQEIFDRWFDDDLEGSVIGITELQSLLNSAGRQAKMITYLEKCLNQRRKSDYDIIWDSQRWGSVDKRIRDVTDELYQPMKWHCIFDEETQNWRVTYPCGKDRCNERHMISVHREMPLPESPAERILPLYFLKSWEIGELYDTREKMIDVLRYNPKWDEIGQTS